MMRPVAINATLLRMEQRLSTVCSNMEDLKKNKQGVAQLHAFVNSGVVQSTPAQSGMTLPVKSDSVADDEAIVGRKDGSRGRV